MSGPRFDAVLFDAGGVLVLPDPTVLGPLLAPYGGSLEIDDHCRAHYAGMAAKSRLGSTEKHWGSYNTAYVTSLGVFSDYFDHAVEALEVTRSPHLWRWPIPATLLALAALAEADVPMGVVSNASGQIEAELRRGQICQVGDGDGVEVRCVVDSDIVGVSKPDPRIFDFALAHFSEFERSRVAYIGDSVTMDIGGATAAGLHPILVDPYDNHPGATFERIRSVGEIVSMF
jgi:putative hydrolase of the HAD superfamily